MDKKTVGKNLAARRKAADLTQEALGERLSLSNKTISRWETGVFLPDSETLLRLAEFYGVTVDELLFSAVGGKAPKPELFSTEERLAFWKRNFLAEYKDLIILSALVPFVLLILGIVLKKPLVIAVFPLVSLFLYGHWNNKKDAYAEYNTFRYLDRKER